MKDINKKIKNINKECKEFSYDDFKKLGSNYETFKKIWWFEKI